MHWHDHRVHQSMEGRKVEHRSDHLHRHRDQHRDQLVHYGDHRSMERGGEKQRRNQGAEQKKANCKV